MSDLLIGYPSTYKNSPDEYLFGDENDLQFSPNGLLMTVEKTDKLKQSIGKILTTSQGRSIVAPNYGTILNEYIGAKLTDQPIYALIKQTVIDALGYQVALYEDSTRDEEKTNTFESLSIKVDKDSTDLSRLIINIVVTDPNSVRSSIKVTM